MLMYSNDAMCVVPSYGFKFKLPKHKLQKTLQKGFHAIYISPWINLDD
jgi:hypothetical protein